MSEQTKHHCQILSGGGAVWANCACGWRSSLWRSSAGASVDFARHLTAADAPETSESTTEERG